jgi:exopolysaccharide biosynthesis polyprenyl glycosylphosphotransferase
MRMESLKGLVRRNWRAATASFALVLDASIVVASFLLAALLSFDSTQPFTVRWGLLVFAVTSFLVFATSQGVYRTLSYTSFRLQAFKAGKAYVYSGGALLSALFLTQSTSYPRVFLVTYLLVFPPLYVSTWSLFRTGIRELHRRGYGRWNTLAIGSEPYLDRLLRRLRSFPELGYDVVNVITTPFGDNGDGMLHVERSTVERIVEQKNINVITFSSAQLNGSFDQLEGLCRRRRVQMRVISPESELLFSKVGLHDLSGVSIYTPHRRRIDALKAVVKRGFDILVAGTCVLVLSPFFLLVALATKIESRGPILFRQKRSLTDQDEPFDFFKFRSMVLEADEIKESLMNFNESSGPLFKIRNDPRLTRVGKFIRRYSIDELPQLLNVLKGDMSLVGPRPLPVKDFARMEEEDHMGGYFRERANAKPGMTGLWQISGRSDIGFRQMVLLDLYYIEHQTILFDIEILAQTIPVVLFGKGAY